MRRSALLLIGLAMLAAGCPGGPDPGANPDASASQTGSVPASPGSTPQGPVATIPAGVSPSPPGLGGAPSGVPHRLVATGLERLEERIFARPVMLLARTPQEAALVAPAAPASARQHLTGWNRFADAALILVTAGIQPNPSYRITVRSVSIVNAGKEVLAASVIEGSADAEEGFAIPWAIVSIPATSPGFSKRCLLNIEGEAGFPSDCRGRPIK